MLWHADNVSSVHKCTHTPTHILQMSLFQSLGPVQVTLHRKNDFTEQDLEMGMLCWITQANPDSSSQGSIWAGGRIEVREQKRRSCIDGSKDGRCRSASSEDRGATRAQEIQGTHLWTKRERNQILPETFRGARPCRHLDSVPVKLILHLWPSEFIQEDKFELFEAIKLVTICYSSKKRMTHMDTS